MGLQVAVEQERAGDLRLHAVHHPPAVLPGRDRRVRVVRADGPREDWRSRIRVMVGMGGEGAGRGSLLLVSRWIGSPVMFWRAAAYASSEKLPRPCAITYGCCP